MKKIYLIISAMALTLYSVAQQQNTIETLDKADLSKIKPKALNLEKNNKVSAAGVVKGRFDVSYSLPNAHGYTINTSTVTGLQYDIFVSPTFVDSTVRKSSSTQSIVSGYKPGVTFDPKSIIFTMDNSPLLTKSDSYILDTVWIGGNYQRRYNTLNDTLYVEVVWGDTANAAVYGSFNYSSAPMSTWGAFKTPLYTTNPALQGYQSKYSAPSTNKLMIKHILTKADSTYLAVTSNYLPIVLNGAIGQTIPANNIVTCGYSFRSAGTHTNGAISYTFSSSSVPGTESGWGAYQYAQRDYATGASTVIIDGFSDFGTTQNGSEYITKKGRYGQEAAGPFVTQARGNYYNGFWMDFSIRGTNSTAINELENNGSVLGQNAPNPFDGFSTVTYKLTKDASAVSFIVTDVTGRVVSSEKASSNTGTHTIKLGSYAAGVYYYTLNVDGKTSTKKMIAQ